ncbi:PIG-L deacetylase family protein [Spongiactinospora sp. TRM90649]|uniref:PIG-L deacetylase family protein n=1 Tax=Spongiactinospora sp. TRM90649 TaxID=3031114 RepID=UPI0023FA0B95|nr:PIG-L deacetylase family protein [Spongiactinospora sp. TRM90649]MDF5751337.1 PIG-L family deacetylase [Spongiactinospora sp. TRM90649]
MLRDDEITRVLSVTAHPDDVDFASAGTMAGLVERGVEVVYCVATDGDAGGFDRQLDNGGMAALRRAEQTAAAKAVGVTDVRFLGYRDGSVEPGLGLRRDIARVIRQVRPDLVITHSPERNYAFVAPSHPDHRAVGASALDAVYPDARNPYAFPELLAEEGLDAWTVREVWLSGGPSPDHFVDISATIDRKLAALRSHVSQVSHLDTFDEFVRERFAQTAERAGFGPGSYAEAFQRVSTA